LGFTQPSKPCFLGPSIYEVGDNSSRSSAIPLAYSSATPMCPSVSLVLLTAMAEALDQQKVASSEFHHCFSNGLNASGLAVAPRTPDNISKGL